MRENTAISVARMEELFYHVLLYPTNSFNCRVPYCPSSSWEDASEEIVTLQFSVVPLFHRETAPFAEEAGFTAVTAMGRIYSKLGLVRAGTPCIHVNQNLDRIPYYIPKTEENLWNYFKDLQVGHIITYNLNKTESYWTVSIEAMKETGWLDLSSYCICIN